MHVMLQNLSLETSDDTVKVWLVKKKAGDMVNLLWPNWWQVANFLIHAHNKVISRIKTQIKVHLLNNNDNIQQTCQVNLHIFSPVQLHQSISSTFSFYS